MVWEYITVMGDAVGVTVELYKGYKNGKLGGTSDE